MYSTDVHRRHEFDASIVTAAPKEIRFERLLAAQDPKYDGLKFGVRTGLGRNQSISAIELARPAPSNPPTPTVG
jgi:hypothetical protein